MTLRLSARDDTVLDDEDRIGRGHRLKVRQSGRAARQSPRIEGLHDWGWAQSGSKFDSLSEFEAFSTQARGELLSFIYRMLTERVARSDVHDLGDHFGEHLYVRCAVIDAVHHHIYFFVRDDACQALLCTASNSRTPQPSDLNEARERLRILVQT